MKPLNHNTALFNNFKLLDTRMCTFLKINMCM